MAKQLAYATRIVRLCGGPAALAREIGKSPSVVQHWSAVGVIPDKHKIAVRAAAEKLGVPLTEADFFPRGDDQ